jgi:hypothetical protein
MVTIETLIRNEERDLEGFRHSIATLEGKPGTRWLIGGLEQNAVLAERAIAILKAEQKRHRT